MGFFDEIQSFFGIGSSVEAHKAPPVDPATREQQLIQLINSDRDVQRGQEDLTLAQERLQRVKQALQQAELTARAAQTAAYERDRAVAEQALLAAERDATRVDVDPSVNARTATQVGLARSRAEAVRNRDAWLRGHPLESFLPAHFQADVQEAEQNAAAMAAKLSAARNAARTRCDAELRGRQVAH